jgi:hypothetical protein
MFQSTVNSDIAAGIVGELAFEGPLNGTPAILNSGDAANNVIGRAFCYISPSTAPVGLHAKTVQAGGDGLVFCGILANPKVYANRGTTAGGTLAANLALPNGEIGEFVQHTPGIFVNFAVAANVGDQVCYADATGVLVPLAPGAAVPASHTLIPGAVVVREPTAAPGGVGLAIIALNGPLPVAADAV